MHTSKRLRQWLCRKHKVQTGRYVQFSDTTLWETYGLRCLVPTTKDLPWTSHELNRNPDAGKPHVQFDEQGGRND